MRPTMAEVAHRLDDTALRHVDRADLVVA